MSRCGGFQSNIKTTARLEMETRPIPSKGAGRKNRGSRFALIARVRWEVGRRLQSICGVCVDRLEHILRLSTTRTPIVG